MIKMKLIEWMTFGGLGVVVIVEPAQVEIAVAAVVLLAAALFQSHLCWSVVT